MSDMVVDAVDIICSARHIEMFSTVGEYLATSDGVRVDDELECQRTAYMLPCSFKPSVSQCQLKVSCA
jgi:Domain of unknown function (DUF4506)